jgi:hypothetical protein
MKRLLRQSRARERNANVISHKALRAADSAVKGSKQKETQEEVNQSCSVYKSRNNGKLSCKRSQVEKCFTGFDEKAKVKFFLGKALRRHALESAKASWHPDNASFFVSHGEKFKGRGKRTKVQRASEQSKGNVDFCASLVGVPLGLNAFLLSNKTFCTLHFHTHFTILKRKKYF